MRAGALTALAVIIASAMPVEAQLGGLIRRGADAAKKQAEPKTEQPAANQKDPFADPAVVRITQDQAARFQRALQYEVDKRNELRAELKKAASGMKSPAEYEKCAQEYGMSPEAMKLIQDMADKSADGSAEALMKNMTAMQTEMEAGKAKRCGADPRTSGAEAKIAERLRQIEAEASDVAMPPGWTPRTANVARAAFDLNGRPTIASLSGIAEVAAGRAAQAPNPLGPMANHPFLRAYAMLKERVPRFCESKQRSESNNLIQVKSDSGGLSYVFAKEEADALTPTCSPIMSLFNTIVKGFDAL
jgi:hypothetical protein